jgi:hypothetical protein
MNCLSDTVTLSFSQRIYATKNMDAKSAFETLHFDIKTWIMEDSKDIRATLNLIKTLKIERL